MQHRITAIQLPKYMFCYPRQHFVLYTNLSPPKRPNIPPTCTLLTPIWPWHIHTGDLQPGTWLQRPIRERPRRVRLLPSEGCSCSSRATGRPRVAEFLLCGGRFGDQWTVRVLWTCGEVHGTGECCLGIFVTKWAYSTLFLTKFRPF